MHQHPQTQLYSVRVEPFLPIRNWPDPKNGRPRGAGRSLTDGALTGAVSTLWLSVNPEFLVTTDLMNENTN